MNLLILGGTGSLGKSLVGRFLEEGHNVFVSSRDEAKHVLIKQLYPSVHSLIGDIRDSSAVFTALLNSSPDLIINAAALKNVPETEACPLEAVKTNLLGSENLIEAANHYALLKNKKLKVLTVSTDKACRPINSYGMAKALQERIHIRANSEHLICNGVRYGNVLESRGSVIPLLKERLSQGKDVYITDLNMTRFFLTLSQSVALIKEALEDEQGGKIFVPRVKSAKIIDLIEILKTYYKNTQEVKVCGIRPGEKIHEILISDEEASRVERRGDTFVLHDIFENYVGKDVKKEYSSKSNLMSPTYLEHFLKKYGVF